MDPQVASVEDDVLVLDLDDEEILTLPDLDASLLELIPEPPAAQIPEPPPTPIPLVHRKTPGAVVRPVGTPRPRRGWGLRI